jgi:hypothetical protein
MGHGAGHFGSVTGQLYGGGPGIQRPKTCLAKLYGEIYNDRKHRLVRAVFEPGYAVVVEHKDVPKPKWWKRNKHTFLVYRRRFAGHASETTEVATHPTCGPPHTMPYTHSHTTPQQCDLRQWPSFFVWKKHVEGVLRKLPYDTQEVPNADMNAAYRAIPPEVQTLLLGETVTVADLSMHDDPLGFESVESAFFGNIANTFTSPTQNSPVRIYVG